MKDSTRFADRFQRQGDTTKFAWASELPLTWVNKEIALQIRRERHLRLPDALVLASALHEGCLLITRNPRDFRRDWVEVRVPYEL